MALVDYSSSSDGEDGDGARPVAKQQKKRGAAATGGEVAPPSSSMPPLPSEFHDLYAATVRQSTVDDPSLHQGRKRQVPHIAGHWPSHVYIEWRPSYEQHAVLTRLLTKVEESLDRETELHPFLTSDLGAPLPLHVSLSRPLSLATADKDDFLQRVSTSLGGAVRPFAVRPRRLAWFASPDSNRCFLVLGVAAATDNRGSDGGPLMELLRRSNAAASRARQPLLYQADEEAARRAFHVSIAWTFGRPPGQEGLGDLPARELPLDEVMAWTIGVDSVKVKIGNTVTSIALSGHAPGYDQTRFLFDEA
ncbi:Unidentified family UPF0406 [Cordyceps militaris]|uniref:U6 snRNA phosphodiesterase n=1 Tax=Cordyceps militaris TaxID=73501 RepID=A0A2H4SHN4_CORMI|nr:Unidentified family UPF0406 [Cordyceps militaris]